MTLLGAEALTDYRFAIDEPVYRAINGLGWPWLDAAFGAASTQAFGIAGLVVMAVWLVSRFRQRSALPLLSLAAAVIFTDRFGHEVLKPFFGRLRPCFALPAEQVRQLAEVAHSGSMPSLHSANAFAVAVLVTLWNPRAGWVALPFAALIALSRVGLGVHWPTDILAGAAFGGVVGWLCWLLAEKFAAKVGLGTTPAAGQ